MNFKNRKRVVGLLVANMLLSSIYPLYGNHMVGEELSFMESYIENTEITTPAMIALTTAASIYLETPDSKHIVNPGFENGLEGWENPSWAAGSTLLFALDESNGVNGGRCAKLENNVAIEQNLKEVQPRTAYILKVLVKGTGRIEIGAGDNKQLFDLTDEYREISVDIRTDDNCKARIYAYVPNGSQAFVDNFSVELKSVSTVDGGRVVIRPENQLQTFDGWGTSLVWFGNVIGGWSEENRTAISDLLFDAEKGLGFNILRYNIGGGDAPGHDHMRAGGEMEGFATGFNGDGSLQYDWEADENQIVMLKEAIDRGVNITEAFSNSPPYFMTHSGCASGNTNGSWNNLKDEYYDDFADYLTEVTKHFKEEHEITFDYLEPLNEPDTSYWKAWGGQEGCHFDAGKQAEIIKLTKKSLVDKELYGETVVAAMDESILDTGLKNFQSFDKDTKDSMEKWNVHTYGGSKRKESKNAAAIAGKDLWMSEVDLGGTGVHNPDSILPGIDLADRILYDMKHIQPTAWVIWQAVENWPNMMPTVDGKNGENSNWGLIMANFEGEGVKGLEAEAYRTTKKYYSMMQYSKFIKPGSVMLQVDNDGTVAFYNKENKKLVFVNINKSSTENKEVEFDLTGFDSTKASAQVYVTSGDKDCEQVADATIENGVLTHVAERQSITTYVIDNIVYDDSVIKLNESTITDETEDNRFEYQGNWGYTSNDGAYVGDHVWSTTVGHKATLSFDGTQAQIYGIKANNHGIAKVTVDKGTVDEQVTEIDLYNGFRETDALIFDTAKLETPLTNGKHTLEIEVIGEKK